MAMKKTMNRLMAIAFATTMLANPMVSVAEPLFTIEDGVLTAVDLNDATDVIIPNDVTSIGNGVFNNCDMTSVTIPDSVTDIGEEAFFGCYELVDVTIPDSVTNMGVGAFAYCYSLTNLTIGCGVKRIEYSTFAECDSLLSVTIPNSVTRIGDYAFRGCHGMKSVTIPDSVIDIGQCAFAFSSFESIMIPTNVKRIGERAFENCRNLTNIVICAGDIGESAFMSCGLEARYERGCETRLVLGEGVTSIGSCAFDDCEGILDLSIPFSVTNIGERAFDCCSGITNLTINCTQTFASAYRFCQNVERVTIGDKCVRIDDDFGRDMRCLRNVSIGKNVQIIGNWAFENFHGDAVHVPDNVQWIGEWFLYDSKTLTNVTFGSGVVDIGEGLCCGCESLSNVVFNGNAPMFGFGYSHITPPFYNVSPECTAYVRRNSTGWGVDIPGMWNGIKIEYIVGPILEIEDGVLTAVDLNGTTDVVIPNTVTGIADTAFSGLGELESVTIPAGVTSIGQNAFSGCNRLWANWYKAIANASASGTAGADNPSEISLTVTNVVVHYVTQSVPSAAVTPAETTGIVNVIAEVTSGGPVAIASTWAEQYPRFETKFGSDFSAALTKPTGKHDGAGNAMLVWQDFVAGTDPTNPDDVFTASITFDAEGKPVISWTPELSEAEAAKRSYKTYGKVQLTDSDWTLIADDADSYNFFRVTVEMK